MNTKHRPIVLAIAILLCGAILLQIIIEHTISPQPPVDFTGENLASACMHA